MAAIAATAETGLKVASIARFDKLATLDRSIICRKDRRGACGMAARAPGSLLRCVWFRPALI
jgi:hypothetical protein